MIELAIASLIVSGVAFLVNLDTLLALKWGWRTPIQRLLDKWFP